MNQTTNNRLHRATKALKDVEQMTTTMRANLDREIAIARESNTVAEIALATGLSRETVYQSIDRHKRTQ
jgi:DNA-binding phage protein